MLHIHIIIDYNIQGNTKEIAKFFEKMQTDFRDTQFIFTKTLLFYAKVVGQLLLRKLSSFSKGFDIFHMPPIASGV